MRTCSVAPCGAYPASPAVVATAEVPETRTEQGAVPVAGPAPRVMVQAGLQLALHRVCVGVGVRYVWVCWGLWWPIEEGRGKSVRPRGPLLSIAVEDRSLAGRLQASSGTRCFPAGLLLTRS